MLGTSEPVHTLSRDMNPDHLSSLMNVTLNAATSIRLGGSRHLHVLLLQRFSDESTGTLELLSEARQFCSYIIMTGRIISATQFEPKHALIVQNKDELKVILDLETLPTPKEFKDAIQALSPEQQRFAKAYRAMQLESTLFGVAVVQIKPALERVLRLSPDSLTKEIRLNQVRFSI